MHDKALVCGQMKLPTEEIDDVAAMRGSWRKITRCASNLSTDLHNSQVSHTMDSEVL